MSIEVISERRVVKARKTHTCNYCRCETINAGDEYATTTLKYNGDLYTWKSHLICEELVSALNMDGDEGVSDEDFYEDITEAYRDLIPDVFYESDEYIEPSFNVKVFVVYDNLRRIKKINHEAIK